MDQRCPKCNEARPAQTLKMLQWVCPGCGARAGQPGWFPLPIIVFETAGVGFFTWAAMTDRPLLVPTVFMVVTTLGCYLLIMLMGTWPPRLLSAAKHCVKCAKPLENGACTWCNPPAHFYGSSSPIRRD